MEGTGEGNRKEALKNAENSDIYQIFKLLGLLCPPPPQSGINSACVI